METGRLEAFSDGVFAVAITLLALDLTVSKPGGATLSHKLAEIWPSFVGYGVSFLTIGIIWVNHHALFRNFAHVDRPLLFLNLLLLFFVVSIPFATSMTAAYLLADARDAGLAAAIYMAVFEGMSIAFGLLFWWAIRREHMKIPLTPAQARRASIRFGVGQLGYIAGIGIAFVSAPVAVALAAVVAIYYVFEQTPSDSGAAAGSGDVPPDGQIGP